MRNPGFVVLHIEDDRFVVRRLGVIDPVHLDADVAAFVCIRRLAKSRRDGKHRRADSDCDASHRLLLNLYRNIRVVMSLSVSIYNTDTARRCRQAQRYDLPAGRRWHVGRECTQLADFVRLDDPDALRIGADLVLVSREVEAVEHQARTTCFERVLPDFSITHVEQDGLGIDHMGVADNAAWARNVERAQTDRTGASSPPSYDCRPLGTESWAWAEPTANRRPGTPQMPERPHFHISHIKPSSGILTPGRRPSSMHVRVFPCLRCRGPARCDLP